MLLGIVGIPGPISVRIISGSCRGCSYPRNLNRDCLQASGNEYTRSRVVRSSHNLSKCSFFSQARVESLDLQEQYISMLSKLPTRPLEDSLGEPVNATKSSPS